MHILVIEDETQLQKAWTRLVQKVHPGCRVKVIDNAKEAINYIDTYALDYIMSDHDLREGTGGEVLEHVRNHYSFYINRNRFIYVTANDEAIAKYNHPITFQKPVADLNLLRLALTSGKDQHMPTMKELARDALNVQNACNLSGVVHGFSRALTDLRALLEREGLFIGTDQLNRHPISILWSDKIASLTSTQCIGGETIMEAYAWAHTMVREGAA